MAAALGLIILAGFFVGAVTAARVQEYNFFRDPRVEQTIPLQSQVHEIQFHADSYRSMHVTNSIGKRLYKLKRIGDKWFVKCSSNKRLVATIRHKWVENYIVLSNGHPSDVGVLQVSPSLITMDSSLFSKYLDIRDKREFTMGNNTYLVWCGLNHFEIVTSPLVGSMIVDDTHKRVAWVSDRVQDTYTILFDYDSINLEILVSTFLLLILTRGKRLKRPRICVPIDIV